MSYHCAPFLPQVQEEHFPYSFQENINYEISLRTASSRPWLKELQAAHRLVQVLLKGEWVGQYEILDFLIWPEGLLIRLSLKKSYRLAEFLAFLKEQSTPPGNPLQLFWDDEPRWIKLIPPGQLHESTKTFWQTADQIRQSLQPSNEGSPRLFFFYRNSLFSK